MTNLSSAAYDLWPVVILHVLFVVVFVAGFLAPKERVEWRSFGVFTAFIVALFTEMYGFPLTIYLLTSLLGRAYPVVDPFTHVNGHLLVALAGGSKLIWLLVMAISNALFWGGFVILAKGWKKIHHAQGELVTEGIYARVRHPQYLGLWMITVGLLIQWPTIATVLMSPILMLAYWRLASREEQALEERFGEQYLTYKRAVPAFWPHFGKHKQYTIPTSP
ncbi:MAG: methyltransferase family protein [Candidatus Bipolaricaulia bacterium]